MEGAAEGGTGGGERSSYGFLDSKRRIFPRVESTDSRLLPKGHRGAGPLSRRGGVYTVQERGRPGSNAAPPAHHHLAASCGFPKLGSQPWRPLDSGP